MATLGEREVTVDCDVLQADGGTRTASLCGGYVALHDACTRLVSSGAISRHPLVDECAAISVGIVDGEARLDLPYEEDSRAEVDMNVVMTGQGRLRGGCRAPPRAIHSMTLSSAPCWRSPARVSARSSICSERRWPPRRRDAGHARELLTWQGPMRVSDGA